MYIYIYIFFILALKPKVKSHYRGHKMAMWLNLIPQLHQPGDEDVSMRHHHFREHGDHFYSGILFRYNISLYIILYIIIIKILY